MEEKTHAQKISLRRWKLLKRIWDIITDRTLKEKQKLARIYNCLKPLFEKHGIHK